ncbi:MAG: hypothetical protein ACOC80_15265 [Petrotogales bacterium]
MTSYEDVKNVTTQEYYRNNEFAVDMFNSKYAHTIENEEKEQVPDVFYRNVDNLIQFEKDRKNFDT